MTPVRSKTAAVSVYPFEKMQTDLQYRYVTAGVLPEAATASLQRKTPHLTSPSGRAAEQNKARHCACTNCRGEDMKCNAAARSAGVQLTPRYSAAAGASERAECQAHEARKPQHTDVCEDFRVRSATPQTARYHAPESRTATICTDNS